MTCHVGAGGLSVSATLPQAKPIEAGERLQSEGVPRPALLSRAIVRMNIQQHAISHAPRLRIAFAHDPQWQMAPRQHHSGR